MFVFMGEIIKFINIPITPQIAYKNLPQSLPFNIPTPLIIDMGNPIYIITYCKGMGRGFSDMSSLTMGLFKLNRFVNTEITPETIKSQAITVTDLGLFVIFPSF
jgi:hypothetical protein